MKIAILEDRIEDYTALSQAIQSWSVASRTPVSIDHYSSGEHFLATFEPNAYELIFFDIYMDKLTGIDTAKQIRAKDIECLMVFVTTSTEYVWDSMPLHPFDYLIKPCDPTRVSQVLSEASRILPNTEMSLTLTYGRQKVSFLYSDLISLEADRHHSLVSSAHKEPLRCYIDSFSGLWELLSTDKRFLMCNRGIILNMDYIEKMDEHSFIMKNGRSFPIRQNNYNSVIQTFLSYQFEQARKLGKRYLQ